SPRQQRAILDPQQTAPDCHFPRSCTGQRYNVGLRDGVLLGDSPVKLTNEFTVAVPIERAWETLLDIERVAGFLPGAKIEPSSEKDVYHGSMRVKVGPMVMNYTGTARLARVDESERIADIAVEARDTKGQGTASATIHNRLLPGDGGTRVLAETDLSITGRQAQFGRGIMQDVAGRMLDDFAHRFEQYLLHGDGGEGDQGRAQPESGADQGRAQPESGADQGRPQAESGGLPPGAAPPAAEPADEDALDLGTVLFRTPAVQRAGLAALAVIAL